MPAVRLLTKLAAAPDQVRVESLPALATAHGGQVEDNLTNTERQKVKLSMFAIFGQGRIVDVDRPRSSFSDPHQTVADGRRTRLRPLPFRRRWQKDGEQVRQIGTS